MDMRFKHTNRPGFLLGFIDFFTAGLFFLVYMPAGGLQKELEEILGHKVRPYWQAYALSRLKYVLPEDADYRDEVVRVLYIFNKLRAVKERRCF